MKPRSKRNAKRVAKKLKAKGRHVRRLESYGHHQVWVQVQRRGKVVRCR